MSDYKRWISYIYYYEKNVKKNNIGYVRVETRGEITKFTLHINVLSVVEPMNVYVLYREPKNNDTKGIRIGAITMDRGVGHGVYSTYTNNIMETGLGMNDIGGIIVFHEKDRFYASEWDDNEINIEKFGEYGQNIEQTETENLEEREQRQEHEQEQNHEQEEGFDFNMQDEYELMWEQINENKEEADRTTEYLEELENAGDVQGLFSHEENIDEENTTDVMPETVSETKFENELKIAAENMLKTYPYMYPFEDDDIDACVRIEPKDIENLPINAWIIANNSFLLKGYYGYRHIILFKIGKDKPRYMIGVPGINHNHENFIANMFGFKLFRPIKKTKNIQGEFGYWCIDIGN